MTDSNPYSRLMALQRMGIVQNYKRIRDKTVLILLRNLLMLCLEVGFVKRLERHTALHNCCSVQLLYIRPLLLAVREAQGELRPLVKSRA